MPRNRLDSITYFTPDELRRLFAVIGSKRDKAIFLIAYRHGLRASEIGRLRVVDIDWKRLRIKLTRLKGSFSGEHPLESDEARILKSYLKEREQSENLKDTPLLFPSNRNLPIGRRMLGKLIKQYGMKAQLQPEKLHFHTLKHSIATHLLEASDDIRFVQDWLGILIFKIPFSTRTSFRRVALKRHGNISPNFRIFKFQ